MKALLKVYPRENELRQLVGRLNELGLSSFNEALESIERGDLACHPVEHFIIRFLSYPSDLKLKAEVLVAIHEASPKVNELAGRIQCWQFVCDSLLANEFLKETVGFACQVAELLLKQSRVGLRDISMLF